MANPCLNSGKMIKGMMKSLKEILALSHNLYFQLLKLVVKQMQGIYFKILHVNI